MARMNLLGALSLAIVFTMAGAGALLALEPGHDHDDHAHLDTSQGLLVTNRAALKICVEAGSSAQPQSAIRASLRTALAVAKEHPSWRKAYGSDGGTIDFGCPQPRLPERFDRRTTIAGPGVTDTPSAYRAWLYLLDQATADRVLGAETGQEVAAAELMRDGTVLFPVSTALLLRDTRLNDIATLAGDLTVALGLAPYQAQRAQIAHSGAFTSPRTVVPPSRRRASLSPLAVDRTARTVRPASQSRR